jgi:hypothetical protein
MQNCVSPDMAMVLAASGEYIKGARFKEQK